MATFNFSTTIKIYGGASAGQTLASNQTATVTYATYAADGGSIKFNSGTLCTVNFGPGETIYGTAELTVAGNYKIHTRFVSGVVFINSP